MAQLKRDGFTFSERGCCQNIRNNKSADRSRVLFLAKSDCYNAYLIKYASFVTFLLLSLRACVCAFVAFLPLPQSGRNLLCGRFVCHLEHNFSVGWKLVSQTWTKKKKNTHTKNSTSFIAKTVEQKTGGLNFKYVTKINKTQHKFNCVTLPLAAEQQ